MKSKYSFINVFLKSNKHSNKYKGNTSLTILIIWCILSLSNGLVTADVYSLDCHDIFMGHFKSGGGGEINKNLQIIVINPNGVVSISRDSIAYIEKFNYITNVKLFPAIFSNNDHCIHSQSQLFNPSQKKISFGDRGGIIINPSGLVTYKPIWSTVGEFKFNVSCEKNLFYGWSKSHFITLTFTNENELNGPCQNS